MTTAMYGDVLTDKPFLGHNDLPCSLWYMTPKQQENFTQAETIWVRNVLIRANGEEYCDWELINTRLYLMKMVNMDTCAETGLSAASLREEFAHRKAQRKEDLIDLVTSVLEDVSERLDRQRRHAEKREMMLSMHSTRTDDVETNNKTIIVTDNEVLDLCTLFTNATYDTNDHVYGAMSCTVASGEPCRRERRARDIEQSPEKAANTYAVLRRVTCSVKVTTRILVARRVERRECRPLLRTISKPVAVAGKRDMRKSRTGPRKCASVEVNCTTLDGFQVAVLAVVALIQMLCICVLWVPQVATHVVMLIPRTGIG